MDNRMEELVNSTKLKIIQSPTWAAPIYIGILKDTWEDEFLEPLPEYCDAVLYAIYALKFLKNTSMESA